MKKRNEKKYVTLKDRIPSTENIELDHEQKGEKEKRIEEFYQNIESLKQMFTPSEWYLIATEFGLEGYGCQETEDVAKIFNCTSKSIDDNKKILQKKLQSPECKQVMEKFKY